MFIPMLLFIFRDNWIVTNFNEQIDGNIRDLI